MKCSESDTKYKGLQPGKKNQIIFNQSALFLCRKDRMILNESICERTASLSLQTELWSVSWAFLDKATCTEYFRFPGKLEATCLRDWSFQPINQVKHLTSIVCEFPWILRCRAHCSNISGMAIVLSWRTLKGITWIKLNRNKVLQMTGSILLSPDELIKQTNH